MTTLIKRLLLVLSLVCLSVGPLYAGSQQASGVTAQTIIDRARSYFNESTASFLSDSADLLPYLNYGLVDIVNRSKCLETIEVITLQTAVSAYALSTSYISVEGAIYSGVTTAYDNNPLKGLDKVNIEKWAKEAENIDEPGRYFVWNDRIYIDPTPETAVSGYTVSVFMAERPSGISLTEAVPTPAIYDKALTYFVFMEALARDRKWEAREQVEKIYLKELPQYRFDLSGQKEAQ